MSGAPIDWGSIGTSIASIVTAGGALAGGAWLWLLKQQKAKAVNRADVAEAGAAERVAKAEGAVYEMMERRLAVLEQDVASLRSELTAERQHSLDLERKATRMELHILRLEHLMREAGMTPPPFPSDFP